jgi:hypothetical protein
MKLYNLVRTQHLPIPVEQAWQFFTDPYNFRSRALDTLFSSKP